MKKEKKKEAKGVVKGLVVQTLLLPSTLFIQIAME